MTGNLLYYGDNLKVLPEIPDGSVDLIYLDPPFNSNQDYNVLFEEHDGTNAAAQIKAFTDTWKWDEAAAVAYAVTVETGPTKVAQVMRALHSFLGNSDMMAYLSMMAPRLLELHRVLTPTGSIYLHCDPTASHYLKLVLDAIFGPQNFRNEIIWRRTRAHNDRKITRFGAIHDTILYYSKSSTRIFNPAFSDREELKTHDLYHHTDGKLYRKGDCRAPGGRGPKYTWNGHTQHWRFTEENAQQLEAEGRIVYTKSGMPRLLRPVDLTKGSPLQDIWVDIDAPNSGSAETMRYPTQKPVALLERIIQASSNEGDVVLDPFCGCGTAVTAAQKLGRRWIGIDITHLAIGLIKSRLHETYGETVQFVVRGEPEAEPDARELARSDPWEFQAWALGLVDARRHEARKGADQGIDGRMYLRDGRDGHYQLIFSVKSGKLKADDIRSLGHVIQREGAEMGVMITLQPPTPQMRGDAIGAGFFECEWGRYPRLQIVTVGELLAGKKIDRPYITKSNATIKTAKRATARVAEALALPFD